MRFGFGRSVLKTSGIRGPAGGGGPPPAQNLIAAAGNGVTDGGYTRLIAGNFYLVS